MPLIYNLVIFPFLLIVLLKYGISNKGFTTPTTIVFSGHTIYLLQNSTQISLDKHVIDVLQATIYTVAVLQETILNSLIDVPLYIMRNRLIK